VLLHNPTSTTLDQLPEVLLSFPDGVEEPRKLLSARRHKNFVLVKFDGVLTVNEAEALVGCTVSVGSDDLPSLGRGEVYCRDLVGCAVQTEDGRDLGSVCEVFATGSNDVCVVRQGETEHLIPLIEDVVVRLDVSKGEMIIRPLPGLLDP